MTDDTPMTDDTEIAPTTVTLEFPLDETHADIYEQFEGETVEEVLVQQLQPQVEKQLYNLFQQAKYEQ